MNELSATTPYVLEHQFPHPVAAPYRCVRTAQNAADRCAYLLATVDAFVRYTGSALLADFFSKAPSESDCAQVTRFLTYPTLERWCDLLGFLASYLQDKDPFLPQVVNALLAESKDSALEDLQNLILQCSDYTSGEHTPTDENAAEQLASTLEPGITSILDRFLFLQDTPLVQFRISEQSDTSAHGFMIRWMGFKREPLPITVEFESAVPDGQLAIIAADASRCLVLDPFIRVSTECKADFETLAVLCGLRDSSTLRLESFFCAGFRTCSLTDDDGQVLPLREYLSRRPRSVQTLNPTSNTAQRVKVKSRLLPAERVLEGRFEAVGFIGRGGIGAVYRVFDLKEQQEKAIKILYPDLSRNEFFTRYFVETGRLLAGISHPNIVKVFEASFSKELQENHIIMAHMDGGSLGELMQRREVLPPKLAINVAIGVLEGLEHLHQQGLIHGGIHPGNILFDKANTPCLADFGILKLPSSRFTTFRPLERIHSLRYAAPELLLGGTISEMADIYSMGLVLYEMITGRMPSKMEFVPPSQVIFPVPDQLDAVLEQALAAKPDERFSGAHEFAVQLRLILDSMGTEYEVSSMATLQQWSGHLADIHFGHFEHLDQELAEHLRSLDFQGAARTIQMRIDGIWDLEEKVYWMLQLARILEEHLGQASRAMGLYREALEMVPDNPVAVQALVKHFQAAEQWEDLTGLLEQLAEDSESQQASVGYLEQLVNVYQENLDDPVRAAFYLERLVETTGAEERWVEVLVNLKQSVEDYDGAARALEKWLSMAVGRDQTVRLLRQLGQLYYSKLDNTEKAVVCFERLLDLVPSDADAMKTLRTLYRKLFAFSKLSELLRTMIASDQFGDSDLIEIYQELGEILSSYMYDSAQAREVWNRLLSIDSANLTALSYLERLYLRDGRNEDYLGILAKKAEAVTEPEEKATILVSASKARLEFFNDVHGAREMLEKAMRLAPGRRGIEEALERLYEEHGDSEAHVQLLLLRLDKEQNAQKRAEAYWRLTTVFSKNFNDPASALQVMKKAFHENPRDGGYRRELEHFAAEAGAWPELMQFYIEQLSQLTSEDVTYVTERIAAIATGSISDTAVAMQWLETAAAATSQSVPLLRAMAFLQRRQEEHEGLAYTSLRLLDIVDEQAASNLFSDLAGMVSAQLAGTPAASKVLNALFDHLPVINSKEALKALKDACRSTGDWSRLTDLLEQEEKVEGDAERLAEIRLELGEALSQKGEFAKAAPLLERVLDRNPDAPGAQVALEKCLASTENWKSLVMWYRRWASYEALPQRKLEWLEKAVTIETQVNANVDAAAELYRQMLAVEPDRKETHDSLVDLLYQAGRYSEAIAALDAAIRSAGKERRKTLLFRLARVHLDAMENPDGAISALRQAVALDPDDNEPLDALDEVAQAHKRWDLLLRVLDERAKRLTGSARVPILLRMARIAALEMGLFPAARGYLAEALTLEPSTNEVFVLYREVLGRQEDFKEWARVLEVRFRSAPLETDRVEAGLELADVLLNRLQARVKAIDILETVLELDPKQAKATLTLANLYVRNDQFDKAAPLLASLQSLKVWLDADERLLAVFLSGQTYEALRERRTAIEAFKLCDEAGFRKDEARHHLGVLYYLEGRMEEAKPLLQEALDSDILDPEKMRETQGMVADIDQRLGRMDRSMAHLEAQLQRNPSDRETLHKIVTLSRDNGDSPAEKRYIASLLEVESDPTKRLPLLLRQAELLKDDEDSLPDAIQALTEALELSGRSRGTLLALGDLHARAGDFDSASKVLREAEDSEPDPTRKAQLALTLGLLYAEMAQLPQKAEEHLWRVLKYDPTRIEAFTLLEKMAVESGNWQKQRDLYEQTLSSVPLDDRSEFVAAMRKNLARVLLEKFGDTQSALVQLHAAKNVHPDDEEVMEITASLYFQTDENIDKALDEYRSLVMRHPRDTNLVRQLRKTFSKMKRMDDSWFATGISQVLGDITIKEKAFYDKYSVNSLRIVPKTLDASLVRDHLRHPEADLELSEIIRIVFERMADRLHLKTAKDLGHGKANLFEDPQAPVVAKLLDITAQILGLSRPQVFVKDSANWFVAKESCQPLALVLGKDAFDQRKPRELRFEIARSTCLLMPSYASVGVIERQSLLLLLQNALKIVIPAFPEPPGDAKANAEVRKEMQKAIPPVEMEKIRDAVTALRTRGSDVNLKRWLTGVDKTSARFGLVMANDIEVAVAQVRSSASQISSTPREEIVDDLIRFTASESFTTIRQALGITIIGA